MSGEQLPEGWEWKKLGEVCEFNYGKSLPEKSRVAGGYPVYGSNGIVGTHEQFLVQNPTIIIGRKGAAGAVHLTKLPCFPIDTTYFVTHTSTIDRVFLYYFLRISNLNSLDKSTAIPGLNRNDAYQLDLPLPPLPVQQQIVAKIEELFSELDAGVQELQSALARLKTYRQAVLHHYLNNPDWERVKLSSITSFVTDGDHQAPPKAESGVPFIVISNIKNNRVNFSQTKFVPEEYYNAIKDNRKAKNGDLLYTVTGSYGIPVLLDTDQQFCFQRHIGLIRPNDQQVIRKYLFYVLASREVYNQATSVATGTAQLTVPLSGLRNFKIPLPNLSSQNQIVAEIEERLSEADAMESTIRNELKRAENLRQSILKQAFAGRLVTEDAVIQLDQDTTPRTSDPMKQETGQLNLF